MKKFTVLVATALLTTLSTTAQSIHNNVFTSSQGKEFHVGDDLIIGYPTMGIDFNFIENNTKNKVGLAAKLAGAAGSIAGSTALIGVGARNASTVTKSVQAAGAAGAAKGVANAGDMLLQGENKLTGQHLRILKFQKKGNAKRGEHFYAIVAGKGAENYVIELDRAILTNEIIGVNGELFEQEVL